MKARGIRIAVECAEILVGALLTALGFNLFFVPNKIAPGGFTGLATVVNHLTGFPIGLMTAVINIPLFILNYKSLGLRITAKSVAASLLLSVLLDTLPEIRITEDMLLASAMGGVLMGAGLGLLIRSGTTTGGTDMAAQLLHRMLRFVSVGGLMYALDVIVVILSGFVFGFSNALYAMIGLYLSVRIVDSMLEGVSSAKVLLIISEHNALIADRILTELERGATLMKAEGVYSGADKNVLMVVVGRYEVARAKQIIHQADELAFVIVHDAREIMGEGFTRERKIRFIR